MNSSPKIDETAFEPKFDSAGLLSAIVQDAATGEVLMFAFMDAEALAATRETGFAHFHSRSRGRLWKKGESVGLRPGGEGDSRRLRPGRTRAQGRSRRARVPHGRQKRASIAA